MLLHVALLADRGYGHCVEMPTMRVMFRLNAGHHIQLGHVGSISANTHINVDLTPTLVFTVAVVMLALVTGFRRPR